MHVPPWISLRLQRRRPQQSTPLGNLPSMGRRKPHTPKHEGNTRLLKKYSNLNKEYRARVALFDLFTYEFLHLPRRDVAVAHLDHVLNFKIILLFFLQNFTPIRVFVSLLSCLDSVAPLPCRTSPSPPCGRTLQSRKETLLLRPLSIP